MFASSSLIPTRPDPVVPSTMVPGEIDDDGLPGQRTLFAVTRAAFLAFATMLGFGC